MSLIREFITANQQLNKPCCEQFATFFVHPFSVKFPHVLPHTVLKVKCEKFGVSMNDKKDDKCI